MSNTIRYKLCPVCSSSRIDQVLVCQDHTVSGEVFSIWHCKTCQLRFTQDVPDEASIGKYYQSENYISHSDTNKGLINKLYKVARRYTLSGKRKLIEKMTGTTAARQLLDIGAGTGAFLDQMKRHGWAVTGVEPDATARKMALEQHQLDLQPISMLSGLSDGTFHAITMWHVLEHVHQLHQHMDEVKRLLHPTEGLMFIAVPNYTSPDAQRYQTFWAAYDVPRHLYHFSPKSMRTLLQDHGFLLEKILPMPLDAFYIALLSERYKTGSPNWLSATAAGIETYRATAGHSERASSLIYVARVMPAA